MSTTVLPAWSVIAADAARHRCHVGEHLRTWGAMLHAAGRHRGLPSRWVAAFDSATRPPRSRLASFDNTSTDRDRGEAAADDLWDCVAATWSFVRWAVSERMEHDPGVEHVVAELHAAGRWLAEYPVSLAGHDAAVAGLFSGEGVPR